VKTLTLGYSPCPNDTFIFYALANGRIVTEGLRFTEMLEDVETLNLMAQRAELDVTKVSFHAFGHLREDYCLLRAGGALGKGCGPLVVSHRDYTMDDLRGKSIAIPGRLTTAFLLLLIFDSSFAENVKIMPFNEIIGAVKKDEVDAGLIIHESRFTYRKAGLRKVADLGEWWEKETGCLIPLGAILAKRALGREMVRRVDALVRKSIDFAFLHRNEPLSYIKKHSQEIEDEVVAQHINLYVNDFSLDIGDEGIKAVRELFRRAEERGIIAPSAQPLFF
jgi:1,4-dihydroxy-6-naphthoate synthase